jgi:serine/threonine-protein kinase RsbW
VASKKAGALPTLRLLIPSESSFLGLVRDLTKHMAQTAGFDEATAEKISLAVDEAAVNAMEHAYHGDPGRQVELCVDDAGPELRVEVIDTGDGIDPKEVPEFELEKYVNERRKGGLGVHLMGKIMDSVTFHRSGKRNVCSLVKRKAPPPEKRS